MLKGTTRKINTKTFAGLYSMSGCLGSLSVRLRVRMSVRMGDRTRLRKHVATVISA